jgi:hypothetical protein
VMCLLVFFIAISSLAYPEEPYLPRNPISEGLLAGAVEHKEKLGAKLQADKSEYYSEEEKDYLISEAYRKGLFDGQKRVETEQRVAASSDRVEPSEERVEERVEAETPMSRGRVARVEKTSEDEQEIDFEGQTYSSLENFKGSIRSTRSRMRKCIMQARTKENLDTGHEKITKSPAELLAQAQEYRQRIARMEEYLDKL